MEQPSCLKLFTNHPFKASKIIQMKNARVIDSTDMPSIRVHSRECTKSPGYAFAYPSLSSHKKASYVMFAFLSDKDAKKVIRMKKICKQKYKMLLDELAIHKENYRCYEVGDKCSWKPFDPPG